MKEPGRKRWRDLDALRGFAMLMGVGLHAALSFSRRHGGYRNAPRASTAPTTSWLRIFFCDTCLGKYVPLELAYDPIMSLRTRLATSLLVVLCALLGLGNWAAAVEPTLEELTESDPLGLIANYHIGSPFGLTPDSFGVWACNLSDGDFDLEAAEAASFLQREVVPFLSWLSDGQYQVTFSAAGTIHGIHGDPERECMETVYGESSGEYRGVVVFLNYDAFPGRVGGSGFGPLTCFSTEVHPCGDSYPLNNREVMVFAMVNPEDEQPQRVVEVLEEGIISWQAAAALSVITTVAHEIGHVLTFPHSYTGSSHDPDRNEYNNPMDLMSGGPAKVLTGTDGIPTAIQVPIGTLAINRYEAGWIPPEQVDIYQGGASTHLLAIPGSEGTQMLAIPLQPGVFLTLGARMKKGFDSYVPKEGVEVYMIDQRPDACRYPLYGSCWHVSQRNAPFPAVPGDSLAHVLSVNDLLELDSGVIISVTRRHSNGYTVEINNPNEVFSDVPPDHWAARAIRWAFENRITVGVGDGKFGLGQTLNREQLVTFLCRAYQPGECQNQDHQGSDRFSDVPVNHWANSSIEWAQTLGITTGVGNNEFGLGQILTREQMVTFLHRAELSPSTTSAGHQFYNDLPTDADLWYQAPIGWAYREGITGGVAPGEFGLGAALSREEAVLFLCRARAPDICPPSQTPISSTVVPAG